MLIDWTESVYGDPADELSALFAINNVTPEFKEIFLENYLKKRSDSTLNNRISVYVLKNRIADLVWSIKQLEREKSGNQSALLQKEDGVYQGYYNVRLEALRNEMNA